MILPTPIYSSHHSKPMTQEEAKVLIGIFIVLNIVAITIWIYILFRYLISKQKRDITFKDFRDCKLSIFEDLLFFSTNFIMPILWSVIIIIKLGIIISKHL